LLKAVKIPSALYPFFGMVLASACLTIAFSKPDQNFFLKFSMGLGQFSFALCALYLRQMLLGKRFEDYKTFLMLPSLYWPVIVPTIGLASGVVGLKGLT